MGYSTTMYAVDLEDVVRAQGSKDGSLVAKIVKRYAADIEESNAWFEEELADGAPTLDEALRQIVDGAPLDADYGFQYGYALELLCRHFGARVDEDQIGFIEHLGLRTKLNDERPPIEIPEPDDFPKISHLKRDELGPEIASLEKQLAAPGEQHDAQEKFIKQLRRAQDRAKAVVTFTY
jgi:hypothetical protein